MLRADLHIHTNYSPDSGATPKSIVDQCLRTGLNCIAITDHNTIDGALEVQRIAPFKVIVGEEVKSSAGDIIGLFLKEAIPRNLTPLETVQAIKAQGALVMMPHPFDRVRPSAVGWDAFETVAPHVDIIETFNARNLFNRDDAKAIEVAEKYGLVYAVVSDAHTAKELGRTYNEMPDFDDTPQGFMEALSQATLVTKRTKIVYRFAPVYAKLSRPFTRA
ncbi:MAG: PHP domain-containing protein [Chloroflexi bacterium]|nr:PHP domain-containing protein [Chloroflexota bacterium]MCZ6866176.1 PHP domain-containing protein [Chloroflexota bacterium]